MVLPLDFRPEEEGRRIAREYLSGLGWARQWRDTISREYFPAYDREKREERVRQADQRVEDAEDKFSSEVDKYLQSRDTDSKIVLETVHNALCRRNDLGFFGKRIMGHIKNRLGLV